MPFTKKDTPLYTDGAAEAKPYKPFDQLKYARVQTQNRVVAMERAAEAEFVPGDRVSHPKFGEGEVLECDSKTIRVKFGDDDVKKLALGFAPIEKI